MRDVDLARLALDARIGAAASNLDVVNLLYTNVVGSAPSATVAQEYTDLKPSCMGAQEERAAWVGGTHQRMPCTRHYHAQTKQQAKSDTPLAEGIQLLRWVLYI